MDTDLKEFEVCVRVPSELGDGHAQSTELARPIGEPLLGQRGQRRDVHASAAGGVGEHSEDRELSQHGLARPRGRGDQRVVVGAVDGVEDLRLDAVEGVELVAVEADELLVGQLRDRQRLQLQQLCGLRVALGGDQVAERHGQDRLAAQPAVRHDAHEVLRGQRVVDGQREGQRVLLARELGAEDEVLVVQDGLAVHVLHDHPERLGGAVDLLVPGEVGREGQLEPQHGARDGLHVALQLQTRQLVHRAVDGLAHLGEPH